MHAPSAMRVQHTTEEPNRKLFSFEHKLFPSQVTCQQQPAPVWQVQSVHCVAHRQPWTAAQTDVPGTNPHSATTRRDFSLRAVRTLLREFLGPVSLKINSSEIQLKVSRIQKSRAWGTQVSNSCKNNAPESLDTFQTVTK